LSDNIDDLALAFAVLVEKAKGLKSENRLKARRISWLLKATGIWDSGLFSTVASIGLSLEELYALEDRHVTICAHRQIGKESSPRSNG